MKSFFTGVPDSLVIVENIEVLNDGKLVEMKTITMGTAIKSVDYPDNISNEFLPEYQPIDTKHMGKYSMTGVVSFTLDQINNKLKRIDVVYDEN